MGTVDPVDFELFKSGKRESTMASRRNAHQPRPFIAIREPWDLVVRIAELPGRALIVYLHLRRLWTMSGRRNVTELRWGPLRRGHLSVRTLRRGLNELERAGIVSVQRKMGCKSTVSFLTNDDRRVQAEGFAEGVLLGLSTEGSPGGGESNR